MCPAWHSWFHETDTVNMPVKRLPAIVLLAVLCSAAYGANSISSSLRQPMHSHRDLEAGVQSTDVREDLSSKADIAASVTTDTDTGDTAADFQRQSSTASLKTSVIVSLGAVGLTLLGVCAWAVNRYCCPKPVGSSTTKQTSFRGKLGKDLSDIDGGRACEREPDRLEAFDGIDTPRTDSTRVLNRILQLSRTPGASQYVGMSLD